MTHARARFRALALLPVALALACQRTPIAKEQLLPETMAAEWHRRELREEAPRVLAAAYGGPGRIQVRLHELQTPASGLDMVQRRKPTADSVAFDTERFFVEVSWQESPRDQVTAFVRALQKHLQAMR